MCVCVFGSLVCVGMLWDVSFPENLQGMVLLSGVLSGVLMCF